MVFSVYTLGCKLNQLETEAITDSFHREGFILVPWNKSGSGERGSIEQGSAEPRILLINTCTVTSMAEQKARRIIRKALLDFPSACLIVTGCYAQMEKAALTALGDGSLKRFFVIPGDKKDRVLDLPRFLAQAGIEPEANAHASMLQDLIASWFAEVTQATLFQKQQEPGVFRYRPARFSSHSRAFLKIQDGCDRRCAYCRVSLARGKSQSLGAGEALKALKSLEEKGFAEAVLTGVNISQYGDSGMNLPELLEFLLSGTKTIRLRLSSIEPAGLASDSHFDEFISVLENKRVRPHFHLSLQSGSDRILAKMRRPYTKDDVEKTVSALRAVREDPFLACDIIAGFPGETEEEFENTYSLCEKIGFAWIHAFPFSPRPGTEAFDFPDKVSEGAAVKRVRQLTDLARKGRLEYLGRWEGKEVEAVVEAGERLPGTVPAVSENYLKLCLKLRVNYGDKPAPAPGSLIRCKILPRIFPHGASELEITGKLLGGYDASAEVVAEVI